MPRKPSKTLTKAELRIMEQLWAMGEGTVRQVLEALGGEEAFAYSTVLTTLRILDQKGHVSHRKEGRAHIFFPLVEKQNAQTQALRQVLSRFFGGSPRQLMVSMLEDESLSQEDLAEIRTMLEEYGDDR